MKRFKIKRLIILLLVWFILYFIIGGLNIQEKAPINIQKSDNYIQENEAKEMDEKYVSKNIVQLNLNYLVLILFKGE